MPTSATFGLKIACLLFFLSQIAFHTFVWGMPDFFFLFLGSAVSWYVLLRFLITICPTSTSSSSRQIRFAMWTLLLWSIFFISSGIGFHLQFNLECKVLSFLVVFCSVIPLFFVWRLTKHNRCRLSLVRESLCEEYLPSAEIAQNAFLFRILQLLLVCPFLALICLPIITAHRVAEAIVPIVFSDLTENAKEEIIDWFRILFGMGCGCYLAYRFRWWFLISVPEKIARWATSKCVAYMYSAKMKIDVCGKLLRSHIEIAMVAIPLLLCLFEILLRVGIGPDGPTGINIHELPP